AIKDFKKSVREEEAEAAKIQQPRTIDAEVKVSESSIKS
ncbi:twin-arginine translocase subunit TatA, partial [Acinetobacter variabilis]